MRSQSVLFRPGIFACLLFSIVLLNAEQPGVIRSEFIFDPAPLSSCHAATLAETSDGLIAAWVGGTAVTNPDVCIYLSRHIGGKWLPPVQVADGLGFGTNRLPAWNPVLFQPKTGPLMLFYKVGSSPSTWWGMAKYSPDAGKTWTAPRRLPKGILGPIKNKPVQLPNGDVLSPSGTEGDGGSRVHFERSRDGGINWITLPPVNDGNTIRANQPSLLLHPGGRLQSVGRTREGRVFEIWSDDAGETWGPMMLTELPNPNSGTDAVTLQDGRQLLVYGHSQFNNLLNVALSKDGKAWSGALVLEDDFSRSNGDALPSVIQSRDGLVHIVHTWDGRRIKHVVVDPSRLELRPIVNGAWPGETNSIGIEFANIPPGSFVMGDAHGEVDERTRNIVTISKPFKMAMDEVTLEQFRQFRPQHGSSFNGKATGVSWNDAVAFCKWLSKKEGKAYRLPTEAEWEFACRAGTTNRFWSGAEPPAAAAPNPWNLRGLHDEVMEWCADWFAPYTPGAKTNPVGPASGKTKVVRGDEPDNDNRLKEVPGRTVEYFQRSANRAGLPPGFGIKAGKGSGTIAKLRPGLAGVRSGNDESKRAQGVMLLDKTENHWGREFGANWTAQWVGQIESPTTGVVLVAPLTANGVRLKIGGKLVFDSISNSTAATGQFTALKGERLPVLLEFSGQGDATLDLQWAWGTVRERIPASALSHTDAQAQTMSDFAAKGDAAGFGVLVRSGIHRVGFRVVQEI